MIDFLRGRPRLLLLMGLALLVSSCNDAAPPTGTTPGAPPVTTLPPVTTVVETTTSTTTSTTLPPATSPDPQAGLVGEVEELIDVAEEIRGLGFLVAPDIVVLDPVDFATRVGFLMSDREDELRNEAMALLLQLVGLLDDGEDLEELRGELLGVPEHAWYDATTGNLLISDRTTALGPHGRAEIIHEILHGLTDQHYRWSDARASLLAASADDRLAAFDGLVEGDATYFQLVYIQQLTEAEQAEIALEYLEPSPAAADAPPWLLRDLAFPFDAGFEFVADLVAVGGIAAVDRAYLDPPQTSEHILHPERYRRGEVGHDLGSPGAALDSYTELPAASFGEWGLRLLLDAVLSPGMLTQTADGWGGDSYQLFITGGGDVAFGFVYLGDAEAHTVEVTQAFIDFAEDVLRLGEGVRTDGGEVYSRNGRPWVFLDREGSGLVVVIASRSGAGGDLADQLSPPA